MAIDVEALVNSLKLKREAEGLSLRGLSSIIGVSFSSLARIERGDGHPDNNSVIRILEWLGKEGKDAGLTFEHVALVHFRANKNIQSRTVRCLLGIAEAEAKQLFCSHPASSSECGWGAAVITAAACHCRRYAWLAGGVSRPSAHRQEPARSR